MNESSISGGGTAPSVNDMTNNVAFELLNHVTPRPSLESLTRQPEQTLHTVACDRRNLAEENRRFEQYAGTGYCHPISGDLLAILRDEARRRIQFLNLEVAP